MISQSPISNEDKLKNKSILLNKRKLINFIQMNGWIQFIHKTKVDGNEIILIFSYYDFLMYESSNFNKEIFKSKNNLGNVRYILELKNGIILILTDVIYSCIIKKKENQYLIYYNSSYINYDCYEAINLIQLENNNIILLKERNIIFFKLYENEEEIEFVDLNNLIKKNLRKYIEEKEYKCKISNLDIIEMNKDIIVIENIYYLIIFSISTNQIIYKMEIKVDNNTNDIMKKLSEDIIFIGGINIIYFISVNKGIIIKKIELCKDLHIIASTILRDNNLIFGSLVNNIIKKKYRFGNIEEKIIKYIQFKYKINKDKIEVEFNSYIDSLKKGIGNIYIKELKDKKLIISSKEYIYVYSN